MICNFLGRVFGVVLAKFLNMTLFLVWGGGGGLDSCVGKILVLDSLVKGT